MFEYIGEMAKDYIYAVTPLLEDALMDRDLVHRQTVRKSSLLKRLETATLSALKSVLTWWSLIPIDIFWFVSIHLEFVLCVFKLPLFFFDGLG